VASFFSWFPELPASSRKEIMHQNDEQQRTQSSSSDNGTSQFLIIQKRLQEETALRLNAEKDASLLREAITELEKKLASALTASPETGKHISGVEGSATQKTRAVIPSEERTEGTELVSLKTENERLRNYIRRQNALIDILRRQKVLLEASTALSLTVKDFGKDLEIEKP
jgi:hypothetical protein